MVGLIWAYRVLCQHSFQYRELKKGSLRRISISYFTSIWLTSEMSFTKRLNVSFLYSVKNSPTHCDIYLFIDIQADKYKFCKLLPSQNYIIGFRRIHHIFRMSWKPFIPSNTKQNDSHFHLHSFFWDIFYLNMLYNSNQIVH